MLTHTPGTVELLAMRKLGKSVDERWVAWAVSMLVEGQDTPALRILAGEAPPFNQFEMADLVDRVFRELGLEAFDSPHSAAVGYASVLARGVLDGKISVQFAVFELSEVYVELDFLDDLQDFYRLRHARDDLQESDIQYYWTNATRETIDEVIRDYCREWLEAHAPDA